MVTNLFQWLQALENATPENREAVIAHGIKVFGADAIDQYIAPDVAAVIEPDTGAPSIVEDVVSAIQ